MTKENQPINHPESLITWPFRQFGRTRWQTKALVFGGIALLIAIA